MDERVIRAMAKWPNVPAVFGWLALDLRGRWRLDGGLIRNRATVEAINRNYGCDAQGRWYYQNGPQRAFVDLDYTPWVYVLDGCGELNTHTGLAVTEVKAIWLDDGDNILLLSEHGIGVVSDRDLEPMMDRFCGAGGRCLPLAELEQALQAFRGRQARTLYFGGQEPLRVEFMGRSDVARRFSFDPMPRSPSSAPHTDDRRKGAS